MKTAGRKDNKDGPGWNAITEAFSRIYPGQKPYHHTPVFSAQPGGDHSLHGISAYRSTKGQPHWHFVTYGFSELTQKVSGDPKVSGLGYELMRFRTSGNSPPSGR